MGAIIGGLAGLAYAIVGIARNWRESDPKNPFKFQWQKTVLLVGASITVGVLVGTGIVPESTANEVAVIFGLGGMGTILKDVIKGLSA